MSISRFSLVHSLGSLSIMKILSLLLLILAFSLSIDGLVVTKDIRRLKSCYQKAVFTQ